MSSDRILRKKAFYKIAKSLGFANIRNYAVSGTGIIENNLGEGAKYRDRLSADVIPYSPEYLIVPCSTNDHRKSKAELETEIVLLAAALREGLPETQFVVTSIWPISTESRTEQSEWAAAAKTAWEAQGIRFPYIDLFAQEPITGNGYVGATTGEGNSDIYRSGVNNGHPSVAGHEYMGSRIAAEISKAWDLAV